jgi:transposase
MLTRNELQTIYDQGSDAVFDLFQTLWATIRTQQEQLDALQLQNVLLHERVQELEARLNKNSNNSSKPPSSDGLTKKSPNPANLRQKTGKPSGGQIGHPGHTRKFVDKPDHTRLHNPQVCASCGGSLQEAQVVAIEKRQVFDLPPIQLAVTEHQSLSCVCPHCHTLTLGEFPPEVIQPTQYGAEILALCVYLNAYQLLPLARPEEMLTDLLGHSPSQGTLMTALRGAHNALEGLEATIKTAVTGAKVVDFDETGVRVAQHLHWIHVACTPNLTFYAHHPNRGRKAFAAIGILPHFGGTSGHDSYPAYHAPSYPGKQALCNAHLLREMLGLFEASKQTWMQRMSALLRRLKRLKEAALIRGEQVLTWDQLGRYRALYQQILQRGLRQNPLPARTGRRGRPANGRTRSLLLRLQRYEEAVLRFATDFAVPFDNNQAERDLRMIKVQQKVSGCFRTPAGADHFCRIRGYISTLRKQGIHILTALRSVFTGELIQPCLAPA